MAKLPDGMKMVKGSSGYGFTKYTYKDIYIYKRRDSWYFRTEYLASETGNFRLDDYYGSYKLAEVSSQIDKFIADENYVIDPIRQAFALTDTRKAELLDMAKARHREMVSTTEEYIAQHLANKDWAKLARTAQNLADFVRQYEWALETREEVNA